MLNFKNLANDFWRQSFISWSSNFPLSRVIHFFILWHVVKLFLATIRMDVWGLSQKCDFVGCNIFYHCIGCHFDFLIKRYKLFAVPYVMRLFPVLRITPCVDQEQSKEVAHIFVVPIVTKFVDLSDDIKLFPVFKVANSAPW